MRLYFAAPFTNLAKPHKESKYGSVPDEELFWMKELLEELENSGHTVTFPHRDYHGWGKKFPELTQLCKLQYEQITGKTDVLIAYLGSPQSAGVAIEIGYAVSHKIPVIIIKRINEKITLVAYGLNSISDTKIIEFDKVQDLMLHLKEKLQTIKIL